MASRALITRLRSALSSWLGSQNTGQQSGLETRLDADLRADSIREERGHSREQVADIDASGDQHLSARKRQQPVSQGRGSRHAPAGEIKAFGRVTRTPLNDPAPADRHSGRYALQQIVEIVRNAAGQFSDRLHLLAVPQRFLGAFALGDFLDQAFVRLRDLMQATLLFRQVGKDPAQQHRIAVKERADRNIDGNVARIGPGDREFAPNARTLGLFGRAGSASRRPRGRSKLENCFPVIRSCGAPNISAARRLQ